MERRPIVPFNADVLDEPKSRMAAAIQSERSPSGYARATTLAIGVPVRLAIVGPSTKNQEIAAIDATAVPASSSRRERPASVLLRGISRAIPVQLNGYISR